MFDRRQKINLLCAVFCFGMLGYAIYAEKVLGFLPCPLCMFQRVCIGAAGIVFLVAGLHRARALGARIYGLFVLLTAGSAIAVAGRHVWVQAQPPGTVPACGAPLDALMQMFPIFEVVHKVMTGGGECGTIDWKFVGLSMPQWVLISAVALLLVGLWNNVIKPVR
ncbi:MAG TPA: disulfide bond formation protein B [Steroidobacteraceae bacterium]|nr:disulfide bond formation protein B [Steroidobacteraceae bacterium]